MMKRTAHAKWQGDFKSGKGQLTSQSGVLKDTPYSFTDRFEAGSHTNPEELIAAAHAGCFTMALSAFLAKAGKTATLLDTDATVELSQVSGDWTVTHINLKLVAKVPDMTEVEFKKIATEAKEKCPISRLMKADITLEIEFKD